MIDLRRITKNLLEYFENSNSKELSRSYKMFTKNITNQRLSIDIEEEILAVERVSL